MLLVCLVTSLSIPMNAFAGEVGALQPIGTMGKGQHVLGDGKEAVLYEHEGTGCLTHFWFGGRLQGISNSPCRYLGRAKIPNRISEVLAETLVNKKKSM